MRNLLLAFVLMLAVTACAEPTTPSDTTLARGGPQNPPPPPVVGTVVTTSANAYRAVSSAEYGVKDPWTVKQWYNPPGGFVDDSDAAMAFALKGTDHAGEFLFAGIPNTSIPDGATITGVRITYTARAQFSGSRTPYVDMQGEVRLAPDAVASSVLAGPRDHDSTLNGPLTLHTIYATTVPTLAQIRTSGAVRARLIAAEQRLNLGDGQVQYLVDAVTLEVAYTTP